MVRHALKTLQQIRKILKVCLTILGHYALTFSNSSMVGDGIKRFFPEAQPGRILKKMYFPE